jgi:predicted ATPase
MDGENLRNSSSGTRLLLTLLGILLDKRFTTVLIDEPELGLSPHIQTALARFMYDPDLRQRYCPHLQQVYIATHSHLFLHRAVISNNFAVTKTGSTVSIKPAQSVADLHQLQFKLLGNELESVFLPSAILIV